MKIDDGVRSGAKGAEPGLDGGNLMRLVALVAVLTFLLDQATKWAVVWYYELAPDNEMTIDVWPPFLSFGFAKNEGINFGILKTNRWVLIAFSVAICMWIAIWIWREGGSRLSRISAGLLIGGALGNVWDRISDGWVTDFLNMSCCGIDNPYYFNVADIAIFLGAVGLILFTSAKPKAETKPAGKTRKKHSDKTP